jgi:hypothetical protein
VIIEARFWFQINSGTYYNNKKMFHKKSLIASLFACNLILGLGITGNITFAQVTKDSKAIPQSPKVEKPEVKPPNSARPELEKPEVKRPKPEPPKSEPPKVEKLELKPPKSEPPKVEKPEVKPPKPESPKIKFTDAQIKALEIAAKKANLVLLLDADKQPVLPNEKGMCPVNSKASLLKLVVTGMNVIQLYCVKK